MIEYPVPPLPVPLAGPFFFYSPFIILVFVVLGMAVFVWRTWTADERSRTWWKRFWNTIDLVTVVASFVGVALALPAAYEVLLSDSGVAARTYFGSAIRERAEHAEKRHREQIAWRSQGYRERYCTGVQAEKIREVCEVVEEVVQTTDADYIRLHGLAVKLRTALYKTKIEEDEWAHITAFNLIDDLFQVSMRAAHVALDKGYRPWFWSRVLSATLFWPHVLALAFALRIAKGLAAYKL